MPQGFSLHFKSFSVDIVNSLIVMFHLCCLSVFIGLVFVGVVYHLRKEETKVQKNPETTIAIGLTYLE